MPELPAPVNRQARCEDKKGEMAGVKRTALGHFVGGIVFRLALKLVVMVRSVIGDIGGVGTVQFLGNYPYGLFWQS